MDFSGIDMGNKFVKSFRYGLSANPDFLEELIVDGLRNATHLPLLLNSLMISRNLLYLSMSRNEINQKGAAELANFINSEKNMHCVLEFLDISACQISDNLATVIVDGLTANKTLRYLNLSNNNFRSKDYSVASKLGRILQGHE